MINRLYSLPEEKMVAGENRKMRFRLYSKNGAPFSLAECKISFSMVLYSDKFGKPALSIACTSDIGSEGFENVACLTLATGDTVGLHGKYIYQITIVDMTGEAEIPGQGIFFVSHNIDRQAI